MIKINPEEFIVLVKFSLKKAEKHRKNIIKYNFNKPH